MTPEPSNEYQKLVEAVARAICCHSKGTPTSCAARCDGSPFSVCQAATYQGDARAALSALKLPHAGEMDSFQVPYAAAGHDVASVFKSPSYKCVRCGAHQIDLSEDLAYGEMRKCFPPAGDDGWQGIATAPKDGTPFLAYNPMIGVYNTAFTTRWTGDPDETGYEGFPCGFWHLGDSRSYPFGKWDCVPTHWRPLPTPPAGVSDNG